MKNINIGGVFSQLNLICKKGPPCKNAQKMQKKKKKKNQTLKTFSSLVSLTRHFTNFVFLEQLTAMPHFNMQNIYDFFFFLSSHYDTNLLLHSYHFRKKYNNVLANINSESSRVIFSFFAFIQWVKHFCTPANCVTI